MKLKNNLSFLTLFVFICAQTLAQNTSPEVSNVEFAIAGTTVTVVYDVLDAEQSIVIIDMQVSSDGGFTWDYDYGSADGTGQVDTGVGKVITWTYTGEYSDSFKVKILANDLTAGGSSCTGTPTVVYAGKTYNTIQIADQCWLKENLDVGTMIDDNVNQSDNQIIEKYCFDNIQANCDSLGGLYQWDEAMQYVKVEGSQGICPPGWHIPTKSDFQTLKATVPRGGPSRYDSRKLKEVGHGCDEGGGNNHSGFSALLPPTGDPFCEFGVAVFWSSREYNANRAIFMILWQDDTLVDIYDGEKSFGASVRCLRD